MTNSSAVSFERGGDGATTVLLLHGLGATSATWTGLLPLISIEGAGHNVHVESPTP